jgi:hypothetical protein
MLRKMRMVAGLADCSATRTRQGRCSRPDVRHGNEDVDYGGSQQQGADQRSATHRFLRCRLRHACSVYRGAKHDTYLHLIAADVLADPSNGFGGVEN